MFIVHVDLSLNMTSTCSFSLVHGCMSLLSVFSVWGRISVAMTRKVSILLFIFVKS